MEYYVSLGTPAGFLGEENTCLIILDDQMIKTDKITYTLWGTFLGIRSSEQAAEVLHISQQQAEQALKPLLDKKLVINVNDILQCKASRQGAGCGYDKDEQDCIIENGGKPIHLPYISYLIWCCCDGLTSLEEIITALRENGVNIDNETAHKAVHTLLRKNVIWLGE